MHTQITKVGGYLQTQILHAGEGDAKKTHGIYSQLCLQRLVSDCKEGEVYNFAVKDGRNGGESSASKCPDSRQVSCPAAFFSP